MVKNRVINSASAQDLKKPISRRKTSNKVNSSNQPVRTPVDVVNPFLISKKKVDFISKRNSLQKYLENTYGTEVTISKFEQILIDIHGKAQVIDYLYISDEVFSLLSEYRNSLNSLNEERESLKKTFVLNGEVKPSPPQSLAELLSSKTNYTQLHQLQQEEMDPSRSPIKRVRKIQS